MSKQFFYSNGKAIKDLCQEMDVKQFRISFRDNVTSIYLNFGKPDAEEAVLLIAFKNRLIELANSVYEPVTIFDFHEKNDGLKPKNDKAVTFDDFLNESLITMVRLSNADVIDKLLAADVSLTYPKPLTQKTVLQIALEELFSMYNCYGQNEDEKEIVVQELERLQGCIEKLLEKINKSSMSEYVINIIDKVINELPCATIDLSIQDNQIPSTIIVEVLNSMSDKTSNYYNLLVQKGYKDIANQLKIFQPKTTRKLSENMDKTVKFLLTNSILSTNSTVTSYDNIEFEKLVKIELQQALHRIIEQTHCDRNVTIEALIKVLNEEVSTGNKLFMH